jgi:hypothetical protein
MLAFIPDEGILEQAQVARSYRELPCLLDSRVLEPPRYSLFALRSVCAISYLVADGGIRKAAAHGYA